MRSMKQATRDGSPVPVKQDKLLQFLYGTVPGRLLLKPLTAPALSKAAGWFLSTGFSRCFIGPFVRKHGIRLEDFLSVR